MGSEPSPSELVALGLALGAFAAFAQLPLVRLRAHLIGGGRTSLAWATYPAGVLVLAVALVLAAAVSTLAAWIFLVGFLGARTLVIGDAH